MLSLLQYASLADLLRSEIGRYNAHSVRLSEHPTKLLVRVHIIGVAEAVTESIEARLSQERFGSLNLGKFEIRYDRPSIEACDHWYHGYHSGSIRPGDTICSIEDSTLTIAVRRSSEDSDEWQLVRWCIVESYGKESARNAQPVDLCIV